MRYHTEHRIPSMVVLAGEYGMTIGGSALTIPIHAFHTQIREADPSMLGITHHHLMETLSVRWKEKIIWIE